MQKKRESVKYILVTGGAGFIGSAVVRHLIDNTKHQVLCLDKLTYAGNLDSLKSVSNSNRYRFRNVDICNRKLLSATINEFKPEIIIHLAAESHVDRSIDSPADFVETNIIGTYCLLESARAYWETLPKQNKNKFRFHHVSTDEVYGDLAKNDDLFTENTAYSPSSPYSASKASSDHLVRAWNKTYGLPVLVSNCSNNYGPYQFPEKFIPHIILNALAGKPLPIYGCGDNIRDWLHVEDHARALELVATRGVIGETYNIGGHNEKKNLEVVENICELLEQLNIRKPRNTGYYKDLIIFVKDRPGHDFRYAVDASKIEKKLGWIPSETFESGLYLTVNWYLNNETWWRRILNGDYMLGRQGENL